MKVIAFLEEPAVVRSILEHLGLPAEPLPEARWGQQGWRLAEVLSTGLVDHAELAQALAALDGLPPTSSPYVLQTFDRALAATRLAGLSRSA